MKERIMILGACGQIGTELTLSLRKKHGSQAVVACDLKEGSEELMNSGPFEQVNAMDAEAVEQIIDNYQVTQMYHLVAMLSATAEQMPLKGWDLNMQSLMIALELAKKGKLKKLFWPSSMGAFGPSSPKTMTPQHCVMEPTTVYGISKLAGEHWCQYYFDKYGVDVRSIRYPGIISWKTKPGGGTTDYAVDIYFQALEKGHYTSFLSSKTKLPMMYMDDAVKATIELMEADPERLRIRTSYNLAAMSFDPSEMEASIKKHLPDFTLDYAPDFRQEIADSWPQSIDDTYARKDWDWKPDFDLDKMTATMIKALTKKS
ncbi:MAG: NAD-dependent epimerase/dehydratase family protein [Flavobacteriaceae bacterium]